MKKIMRGILAAALAASCALGLAACGSGSNAASNGPSAKSEHIVIGTLATEDILPMWAAEDEGLFKDAGLDAEVQVFQSATELIAGITSGEVDLAMTDHMVTASIYASGTDVTTKWVTLGVTPDQGRFGIMTADGKKYPDLKSLAGQPIGVGSNTILEYVMDKLMEQAGIPEDQIVTEELQKVPVRFEAMTSKQVPAAALPGSLLALGEATGCTTVADDASGDNLSQSVMIVRNEFEQQTDGAEVVGMLQDIWNKAVDEINAAPESYRALLVEKAHLSDAVAETYPISTYPTAQLPTQEQVDDVLDWMKHKGYLADGITYDAATGAFDGR